MLLCGCLSVDNAARLLSATDAIMGYLHANSAIHTGTLNIHPYCILVPYPRTVQSPAADANAHCRRGAVSPYVNARCGREAVYLYANSRCGRGVVCPYANSDHRRAAGAGRVAHP